MPTKEKYITKKEVNDLANNIRARFLFTGAIIAFLFFILKLLAEKSILDFWVIFPLLIAIMGLIFGLQAKKGKTGLV